MNHREILRLDIGHSDYENTTIRDYLKLLLTTLWQEGDSFSAKRPIGDSGWDYDLYKPLIINNIINGKIDVDGCIDEVDESAGMAVISELIAECFEPSKSEDGAAIPKNGKPLSKSFSDNGEVNTTKASPPELRKSMLVATEFVKSGILFVAIPVLNKSDGNSLCNESFRRLDIIEMAASSLET